MSASHRIDIAGAEAEADPLAAAARFHADHARFAVPEGAELVVFVFAEAAHEHAAWREAAIRTAALARAPLRINAVEGGSETQRAEAIAYLERAPGVTGQILRLS